MSAVAWLLPVMVITCLLACKLCQQSNCQNYKFLAHFVGYSTRQNHGKLNDILGEEFSFCVAFLGSFKSAIHPPYYYHDVPLVPLQRIHEHQVIKKDFACVLFIFKSLEVKIVKNETNLDINRIRLFLN